MMRFTDAVASVCCVVVSHTHTTPICIQAAKAYLLNYDASVLTHIPGFTTFYYIFSCNFSLSLACSFQKLVSNFMIIGSGSEDIVRRPATDISEKRTLKGAIR